MSLRDELKDHLSEYPSIENHGWTEGEIDQLTEYIWDFLADKIGTVQEKLMNDVEVARERARRAEHERDVVAAALAQAHAESEVLP